MKKIKLFIAIFLIILLTSCNILQKPSPAPDNTIIQEENPLIGQFSTKILDKSSSRVNNLELSASMLNGYVINPGQTFSFNEVIGEASEERGFKKAITLDRWGRKVMGDGGGICQISSTLYNAAQRAGMDIIERHTHNRGIGYVKRGQDATIDFPTKDLKFVNTKDFPVEVRVQIDKNSVSTSLVKKT